MNSDSIDNQGMVQDTLSLKQVFGVIKRNFFTLVLSVMFTSCLAILAVQLVPKKYKSKAVLSIQTSYFQHPLVSDVVSGIQDPGEMGSQRLSLLRLALNDQFLDKLGETYKLYEHPADSPLRALDRELFLKKIEYFSVSPSSFQISIVTNSPQTALAATQDILEQMRTTLIQQRYQQLVQANQAILKQSQILNKTLETTSAAPQRVTLQQQLSTMEANLASLRARFTESHPDVVRMRSTVNALGERIKKMEVTAPAGSDEYEKVFLSPSSRATSQEIFDDLLKKLSHLNIVLEMEKDRANVSYLGVIEQPALPLKPFFPEPIQFLAGGIVAGLILALILGVTAELKRSGNLSPDQAESYFGLELLGELPALTRKEKLLFLDDPSKKLVALPLPARET